MRILHSIAELAEVPGPLSVAIGVFDGVHLGHQALIHRAMAEAAKSGGSAVVLTFDPHPMRVLRPESAPRLLTSTVHKEKLIAVLGCPNLLLLKFDLEFAAQAPEVFIESLARHARPLHGLCVGHQWTFGRGRSGNVGLLRQLGARLGFETIEIDPVMSGGETISSTRIRGCLEAGDFPAARELLGRDYTILGTVQHGAGLGGKIGFPTANLAAHNEQFPPDGVYAVRVSLRGDWLAGVANIGTRPTVTTSPERLLEIHIFDFAGDCYGEEAEVRFEKFLRGEQKFASVDALKAQIQRDTQTARKILLG